VKINCKNNDIEILTPFSYNAIGRPVCSTQGIYFTAGFSGIDNLYILDKHNIVKQISSIETGVSAVAVDNNNQNIALSVYTKDGYRIEYLPVNKSLNKTVTITEPIDQTNYATSFAKTEGGDILTHSIPTNQRNVTSYNSFENLLKIHSWQLYSNGQNMGLMLYTENTLNTLTGLAGFVYNKNEKRPYFTGELNWSVGYPILHLAATTTLDESKPKETPLYYTNKQDYQMGLQLPLNLTRGNYYRSITAEFGLLRTQINELANNIAYNSHSQGYYCDFVLSNQKQAAYQNLGSPLGQNIHLNYKKSFEGVMAQRFRADGFFSVRGIFPNQNLKLQAHYGKQKFESQPLIYTDDFFYTPGYKSYSLYDNIKRAEVSYHLPLCYPDFGFAGLIYLRRIQLAGYYNYSTSESHRFHELEMNSTGGEILFDTKLLNIQSVTWGLRYNYRLSKVDEMFKGNDIDFYFAIGTF